MSQEQAYLLLLQGKDGVKHFNEAREPGAPVVFCDKRFKDLDLSDVDLSNTLFERCHLEHVDMTRANMLFAEFRASELSDCQFSGVQLAGAKFPDTTIASSEFRGCRCRNDDPELSEDSAMSPRVTARIDSVIATPTIRAKLDEMRVHISDVAPMRSEADLAGYLWPIVLTTSFKAATLRDCVFDNVAFRGVDFTKSDAMSTSFSGGVLEECNFAFATMRGTSFCDTAISKCRFQFSVMESCVFRSTRFHDVVFGRTVIDAEFVDAVGLGSCIHNASSHLTLATLRRQVLPTRFLKGCGLTHQELKWSRALSQRRYYSCFISYSTADEGFVSQLCRDLERRGVRCWKAPKDIIGGREVANQLRESLRIHDKLLLVLSENSMHSSWVQTELLEAARLEAEDRRSVLFPIRIVPFEQIKAWRLFDSDRGVDVARKVREYHISDFEGPYKAALERLLDNLRDPAFTDGSSADWYRNMDEAVENLAAPEVKGVPGLAARLRGLWKGQFTEDSNTTEFDLTITDVVGDGFYGESVEFNADGQSRKARIEGMYDDSSGHMRFIKKYDERQDVGVVYVGMHLDRGEVSGRWTVSVTHTSTDEFRMTKG